MKKSLHVLLVVLILSGVAQFASAQKGKLSEGKIIYDISYPATELDENTMAMFPTEGTLYVKKDMSRFEMKMGMGSVISISNAKDGSAVSLMDMMGQKMAVKTSKEEINRNKGMDGKPEVKLTDETKEVAGYKCTKAIVRLKGRNSQMFNVWFTRDIDARNGSSQHIEGIDGFMMEFEVQQQGMNMRLSARSVESEPVDDARFQIPSGYREVTGDQMKNALGGGN